MNRRKRLKSTGWMLALILQSLAAASAFAVCTPVADPDLNNDGAVTLADIIFVVRDFGLPAGHPRFDEMADINCDGKVNRVDIRYVYTAFGQTFPTSPTTSLAVRTSATGLTLDAGARGNITTTVDFTSSSTSAPFTVNVSQRIDPPAGLTLAPVIEADSLHLRESAATDYAQTVTAVAPGSYQVMTTATIAETGERKTAVTPVTVNPASRPEEVSMRLEVSGDRDRHYPLPQGDRDYQTAKFSFSPKDRSKAYSVRFEQTITPDTGLALSPSLDGTVMDITGGKSDRLAQWIVTTKAGDYEIVTTATVVETGETVSARNEVRVIAAGSPDMVVTVGTTGTLKPDTVTPLKLIADLFGKDVDKVEEVTVEESRTGQRWTLHEGSSPGIYLVETSLDTHGMAPDECFTFRSIVHTTKGDVVSEEQNSCVTGLPLTRKNITREEIEAGFTAPDGTKVARDVFTARFKPEVPESRIREIVAAHGGIIIGAMPADKTVQVRLAPAPASLEALLTTMHQMLQRPEVVWMHPSYLIDAGFLSLETSDPEWNQQAYLKQIRADEAWYLARGTGTLIAVLDSGIDITHPDLRGKLLRDPNGQVRGYDFGDNDPLVNDGQGHGTHVAGIAAGVTNNSIGIAGIGWESKILPIKVIKGNSGGYDGTDLIEAIKSLRKQGKFGDLKVNIVNMSLGASLRQLNWFCHQLATFGLISFDFCELSEVSDKEEADFRTLVEEVCGAIKGVMIEKKILFVASAGNIGKTEQFYPAACPDVVAVAAVDGNDQRAGFSEYGDWIDIAAPGVGIYSTYPESFIVNCVNNFGCGYEAKSGTSQAAPMVAAAASLLLSMDNALSPKKIVDRLQETAKKLPGGDGLGAGRLDIFEAVFNGGFEAVTLAGWEHFECIPRPDIESDRLAGAENECTPTVGSSVIKTLLGSGLSPLKPAQEEQMAHLSTLPDNFTANKVKLRRRFSVPPDVLSIPIAFKYALISDAYEESFGSHLPDDRLLITFEMGLDTPGDPSDDFADPLVSIDLRDESPFRWERLFDYSLPGGDRSIGWTRWREVTAQIDVFEGLAEFAIRLDDTQNPYNDTEVLIDNIRFSFRDVGLN